VNITVNATVNGGIGAAMQNSQAIENAWRRVSESNRYTRICNPSQGIDSKGATGKRSPIVPDELSNTYGSDVNAIQGLNSNENPCALVGDTGAGIFYEAAKPPVNSTAFQAARYPILHRDWGWLA